MLRYKATFFVFQSGKHDETLEAEFAFASPDELAEALVRYGAQQGPHRMRGGVYSVWGGVEGPLFPGPLKKGYGSYTSIVITKFERIPDGESPEPSSTSST